jgi:hypothetical protein
MSWGENGSEARGEIFTEADVVEECRRARVHELTTLLLGAKRTDTRQDWQDRLTRRLVELGVFDAQESP